MPIKQENYIITRCPLCKTNKFTVYYRNDRNHQTQSGKIVKCQNCTHVFTLLDAPVDVRSWYESGDYTVVDTRHCIFDKILAIEYSCILKRFASWFPNKGSLLDFGCGKGRFLWLAKANGWDAVGVETAGPRAQYGKTVYGLNILTNQYEQGSLYKTSFTVITLFHVLEHIPNPKELLKNLVKDNLTQGGIVMIEVPNFHSLQSKIARCRWMHLDVPRHINHFNIDSLRNVVDFANLCPIKYEYFSFHLGVLGMVQSLLHLFGYNGKIIFDLQHKSKISLIFFIVICTPIAFFLEFVTSFFRAGGVIRIYATKE